jgi:RimJ/RimL family protein N-acetyltransferase
MLETKRLILRKVDAERDFEAWARCMGDEQTVRYLGTKAMNRAEAWRHMAGVVGHWEIRGYGFFSLESKETGEWVGRVGPWNPEGWPAPEVGWTISPDHLRKGYASEAARAAVRFAFETLGWSEVSHVILDGNVASIGVAEKIGSRLIRSQVGIPGLTEEKVHVYGQSRVTPIT